MSQKLKILAAPMASAGHINAVHGLADEFRSRGHEIVFILDEAYAGRLKKNGYEERIVKTPANEREGYDSNEEFWLQYMLKNGHRFECSPLKQMTDIIHEAMSIMHTQVMQIQDGYTEIIKEYKPDLIIYDGYVGFPALLSSGVPLLWLYSAAVNGLFNNPDFPPSNSGLPLNSDRSEWENFNQQCGIAFESLANNIYKSLRDVGIELEPGRMHPFPNFLTVFMQPKELRYDIELPERCLPVDSFVRQDKDAEDWEVPEKLRNGPGKLIYFSMGSFCCAHVPLMRKLLNILAKSPHRFIVSMGPYPEELPGNNMWGQRYLPQTAILQKVDLVITHGGNNTVTETFFYGVPMLVLPFFADQHDNAQRILEVGLGDKADPFSLTEDELLHKIEKITNNTDLRDKMRKIGERIRATNGRKEVVDYVEKNLKNYSP